LDANDHSPQFDYTDSFYSTLANLASLTVGSRIYRVFAIDQDNGANATITYSLFSVSPACASCFTVSSSTGWILRGSGTANVGSEKAEKFYSCMQLPNFRNVAPN
jgi:hypothetical protein